MKEGSLIAVGTNITAQGQEFDTVKGEMLGIGHESDVKIGSIVIFNFADGHQVEEDLIIINSEDILGIEKE